MIKADEEEKLRTICEFLFFDHLKNEATFPRFEQCFQPLFPDTDISMLSIFTEIAGEKRKYITFPRFVNAYKNRSKSKNLNFFYDKLMNSILKKEDSFVGKGKEKCYTYSTAITCGNRQCITLLQVLSDKEGGIHGFNVQYDGVFKCKMFPTKLENDLLVTLEMTLGLIDESPITKKKIGKFLGLKEKNYRDAITHVFGTLDPQTGIITFFGFKCISGKMSYVGKPKGNGFLFGQFGSKLHDIKVQMTLDGIIRFEPSFETNVRKNFFLGSFGSLLNLKDDGPIKDESTLLTLNDAIKINQMVTTPVIADNHFFNTNLKDKISGNDYKEIINQGGRNWLLGKALKTGRPQSQPHLTTLDDCLKQFNEEYNIRSTINLRLKGELLRIGSHKGDKNKGKSEGKSYKKLLHNTKDFISGKNKKKSKINDKNGKKSAAFYLFDKKNYLKLKEGLGKKIYDECLKNSGEEEKEVKKSLLSQIISQPGSSKRFNNNLLVSSTIQRNNGGKKNTPLLKTKIKGKEKIYDDKEMKEKRNQTNKLRSVGNQNLRGRGDGNSYSLYSDGFKFFSDLGGFDDEDDDDFFGFGRNDFNNPFSNFGYGGYNYGYNNGFGFNNYGYNYNYYPKKKEEPKKYVFDPVKYKAAQEKWKDFSEGIKSLNGVYLLQTIGSVIKALRAIEEDDNGTNRISLSERIKLYKLLEANEAIINFLTQERPEIEEEEELEPEEDDILVPDEHPEDYTSLEELEHKIKQIKAQLEKKNIKPDDRKKLEKLYNLYLQQKNILIENETNKQKKEIIDQNAINVNKLLQEEQEKRRKAEEEEARRIEELQKKEEEKKKVSEGVISTKNLPSEENIYRDQQMYKGNAPWTDPLFPAEKKSLCPFDSKGWVLPEDVWESDVDGWEKIKWCRAAEIFDSENFNVFEKGSDKHKISANDIQQGSIGDCYFLSVIGSLCNIYTKSGEKLIEDLFLHTSKTKEHVYGAYIFINGVWELVLVDDYFPYVGYGFKQFAFASSQGNELWVSILEKAWAKINGCYAKIGCGGLPHEVFDVLTEAYSEQCSISSSKSNEIWKKMIESQQKGYVMTAGTSGDVSNLDIEEVGLSPGHAYTVLGVHEIEGSRGKEKVVRLRNPWGNGEWNGDWSDSSSKWTSAAKLKMSLIKRDDGDFYMGYNDFIKYYVTMGIAKIHPDYETTVLKIKKANGVECQLIKVTVNKSQVHTYLSLYQKNPRIITKQGYYQKTALSFIMLCDKDFNYINSMTSTDMHICVEETLKKGEYYIFCDVNYRYVGDNHGFNITSYGECALPLENMTKSGKINISQCLERAMFSYCKVRNIRPNKDSRGVETYSQNYGKDIPFMLLVFNNTSSNYFQINAEVKARGSKSFCIYCDSDASEDSEKVTKELPPRASRAILIMKYTNSSLFSISYGISASSGPSNKANTNNNANNNRTNEDDSVRNDPVFKEEGEAIDESGTIIQYFKQEKNGFTIGIENKGRTKEKFKLILEGLDFTDSINRGRSTSLPFDLSPKERKKWYVSLKARYNGDLSFQFDYA
jgi:hypothetical protein